MGKSIIHDKSRGTVVPFERFLAKLNLYPRATCTARLHPTDSVETVKAQFLWSLNIVLSAEGGGVMDF